MSNRTSEHSGRNIHTVRSGFGQVTDMSTIHHVGKFRCGRAYFGKVWEEVEKRGKERTWMNNKSVESCKRGTFHTLFKRPHKDPMEHRRSPN